MPRDGIINAHHRPTSAAYCNFLQLLLVAITLAAALPVVADEISGKFSGVYGHETAISPAESETNFDVQTFAGGPDADSFSQVCERLKRRIEGIWLGDSPAEHWRPACQVVLHASRESYLASVGRSGGQTRGSSLIGRHGNMIVSRRIDLLVDQQGNTSALAHELTHVVLAGGLGGRPLPPWLDEGIATLADPDRKLSRHHRDCREALDRGTAFDLTRLITLQRLSSPNQFPAFYGQSVTLVDFLCDREGPEKILPFAALALEAGYDRALRESFDIDGVAHLERLWLDHVQTGQHPTPFQPVSLRSIP
ncbi:MAG: hypothetical protein R3C10_09790 [Pirellulales bacterium]